MTRQASLKILRVALLKGDKATALRIYIENRISRKTLNDYWRKYYREAVA